jgi:predicted porin
MKKNISILVLLFAYTSVLGQSISIKAGINKNYTVYQSEGLIFDMLNYHGLDYLPKMGYQAGISYRHNLLKYFAIEGEIGYLNKGQKAKLGNLDLSFEYNYVYLKPSISYMPIKGLSVNAGAAFNKKVSFASASNSKEQAKAEDSDISYMAGLSYTYKRVGIALEFNQSMGTTQTQKLLGDTYLFQHHWYTLSLTYVLFDFKKAQKTE